MSDTSGIAPDEMVESLTGFDEIAIEKAFGQDVMLIGQGAPTKFLRALAFTLERRDGKNDRDAYSSVMLMTLKEVNGLFDSDDDEPMPDEPVTEAGKGDSEPETRPTT